MGRQRPATGKLRIGNNWNAISIIALGQANPLKAVAELVENSIDARAEHVVIVRGKEKGEPYLMISDDGAGIRKDDVGVPDFRYVATHICDSFKRGLKDGGASGIQGEFGIGLLSFWTLGEVLLMTSASEDGHNYEMRMARDDPSYEIRRLRTLAPCPGTDVKIKPLLPGLRGFSGEKLEWYLASELRDRIRHSKVNIRIVDHQARKEYRVMPRQFEGELLHQLPTVRTAHGEIYLELYVTDSGTGEVGLYRSGTRVLESMASLDSSSATVWGAGHLEGIVDAPFLNLTPGTRSGVVRDGRFHAFETALTPVTKHLEEIIEEHKRAEEERASAQMLKRLQRAFREAILALPVEEYDWFEIRKLARARAVEGAAGSAGLAPEAQGDADGAELAEPGRDEAQRDFFAYPGPLHSVRISPTSSIVPVGQSHNLRVMCRDRSGRTVIEGLVIRWEIVEGGGTLSNSSDEIVSLNAPAEPGLVQLRVTVSQGGVVCQAQAAVTVTEQLVESPGARRNVPAHGLPGYTFEHAPAALWRAHYDMDRNLIVVNNGHRDFVYANRNASLKLRYIARLYAKELVQKNFPGASAAELLERMVELTLYMEDNLR